MQDGLDSRFPGVAHEGCQHQIGLAAKQACSMGGHSLTLGG